MSDELSTEETRLLGIHRAIKKLDKPDLVDTADASELLVGLGQAFDLDKIEADLSTDELKALMLGFVGGVAALIDRQRPETPFGISEEDYMRIAQEGFEAGEVDLDKPIAGGKSNQIVAGQETDSPDYVKQTGPRKDEEV